MCEFFSGIAFRNGDIHYNPMTDRHEYLIEELGLNDLGSCTRNWVRFEFTSETLESIYTYKLRIDEDPAPTWCDAEFTQSISEKAREVIKKMILCGVEKKILIGGCWILTGGSIIDRVVSVRIVLMKSSNVGEMWESSNVGVMRGSSKVGVMRGSSKVGVMRESPNVGVMWESSKVGQMRESSKVGEMRESSNVGEMRESSKVGVMRESSNVGVMWESSKVGEMRESSNVGVMWESSNVGVMWESSKILNDKRGAK